MKELIFFSLWSIFFCLYAEYSVGGIFYRIRDDGKKHVNILSGLHFLISPLHQPFLWKFSFWDINYPLQVIVISCLYFIYLKLNLQSKEVLIHNGQHTQSDNL